MGDGLDVAVHPFEQRAVERAREVLEAAVLDQRGVVGIAAREAGLLDLAAPVLAALVGFGRLALADEGERGGVLRAQLYVDGVLVATPATAITSLAPDSLGFCINPRSTLGSASGGGIDEVVYWNRALSPEEIALVQTSYITNPPSLLPPLAITSFKADLAAVVSGDSTMLRWDVPGNVTSATISGVGRLSGLET